MSKSAESIRSGEAVDEAIRTLSEASQRGAVEAKHVVSTSTALLADSFALNRQLIQTWGAGLETMLTAGFEMQKSLLTTAQPLLEAVFGANKRVLKAWTNVAEQQQDTLQRTVQRNVERNVEPSEKLSTSVTYRPSS